MNLNRPASILLFVAGWFLLVSGGVRLTEAGIGYWKTQRDRLAQARELLGRLQGWQLVGEEVARRRDELLGPLARAKPEELSWLGWQGFQQAADRMGLAVVELRPSEIPGRPARPVESGAGGQQRGAGFRLDAKVAGPVEQVSGFVPALAEALPGIRLEQLQVTPQEGNRVQALLRLILEERA